MTSEPPKTNAAPLPHSGPVFEAMMREIDTQLIAEGKPIESRSILAGRAISMKYNVPVPLTSDWTRLPPDLRPYGPLGVAVNEWYEATYADRLKVDMLPGRTVVRLDGDLYVLKIPRIYGRVQFILQREFLPKPTSMRGPATCNILQLVEDLTPNKAALLSDEALQGVDEAFTRAFPAVHSLENTPQELMDSARGDVTTAISSLMERHGRYGASKWASLQAAEKALKAAIALQGGEFTFTHELHKLCEQLQKTGLKFAADPELLKSIQCSPKIRYGEETCTAEEALAAHHACLDLINRLRDAGAGFVTGLG